MRCSRALCGLVSVILVVTCLHAQSPSATINGIVLDTSNAAVPDALIEIINDGTNVKYSTKTNSEGIYSVPNLPPGTYHIQVSKTGFRTIIKPDVVLNVQDARAINFTLTLGALSETVTVEGGAPLINTESAAVSTVVDRRFVDNLPMNGRSFQTLIGLTPGVVLTKAGSAEQGQFSVNGQRADANYFMVDGVSANVGVSGAISLTQTGAGALPGVGVTGGFNGLVSLDAMQEFRILTSSYAPEFGRTPGGQISIVTRSGTNEFHGTLFDYFRNDKLDANDWFANQRGLKKPALRQNDFGGVFGGPIVKNRTFFFFSYEGLRLRLPQSKITTVPSVASREAAPLQLQPFLNAHPVPNGAVFPNGFAEFAATFSDPSTLNATSIRVDHTFRRNLTLFGRYNYAPSESAQRGSANNTVTLSQVVRAQIKIRTLTLGAAQGISSSVSNEVRFNYSRTTAGSHVELDSFGQAVPPPDSALFPSFTSSQNALLAFSITGGTSFSVGKSVENTQRQINMTDNLSWTKGSHALRFGIDFRWSLPMFGPRPYDQVVSFSGLGVTPPGVPPPGSVLSGTANSVTLHAFDQADLTSKNLSVFAQDAWKATRRLALTYGLRWEVNPALSARNGKDLSAAQNVDDPATITLASPGTPVYHTTYGNFAPRVGVAYLLSAEPGWEMAVRGGFGIFFDIGSGFLGDSAAHFPFTRTRALGKVPYPLTPALATPPPVTLAPSSGDAVDVSDPRLKLPYTYQWNVSFEQALGTGQKVSASYVAAVGRRLLRQEALITQAGVTFAVTRNTATSNYQALQLQFQRRLSRGLQVLASYTWSHSIDIASNDSGFTAAAMFVNPGRDRGSSDFDVRHSFSAAMSYDIPSPAWGTAGRTILGGWSVDALVPARSAPPVDLVGAVRSSGFVALLRPDLVPGVPLYVNDPTVAGGRRFNSAAFAPPAGLQGILGRNVLRGFPAWQVNFGLHRGFNLTERVNLQFRSELFNVFNHPNFGNPANSLLNLSTFGRSSQMLGTSLGSGGTSGGFSPLYQIGGPRSIQLSLRLAF